MTAAHISMEKLKFVCLLLFVALMSSIKLNAATVTLLVGQSYQSEISATGYHYLSIESVLSTNPSVSATKMGLLVKATVMLISQEKQLSQFDFAINSMQSRAINIEISRLQ